MTFMESVKRCLGPEYLFKFAGRASRSEYWWFMLFIVFVNGAVSILIRFLPGNFMVICSLIISLLLLPANLGVTVRRLHDRNLSGWWLLVPIAMLFLWQMAGGSSQNANVIASLLALGMTLGYLAILAMPSQPGANRYGPPPNLES